MRRTVRAVLAAALIAALVPAFAGAAENPFPLGKKSVPEQYQPNLSEPVGISFGYSHINDMVDVSDFTFTLGGQPLPPGVIEVSEARHSTSIYFARFDTWVLPFLNVHGMAAVLDGQASDVAFKVNPMPGMPPLPIPATIEPAYTGQLYGVGAMLAGAYKRFFASYDISRQWVTLNIFDDTVPALTQAVRAGVHGRLNGGSVAVYVGGFHLSLRDAVLTGQNFIPGLPSGSFSMVASPQSAWNTVVGGNIQIAKGLVLMAEAGFGTRKQFVIMPSVRF